MIISYNQDIDWILRTIIDVGMEIAFLGIRDFSQEDTFKTKYGQNILELDKDYVIDKRFEDIDRIKPDLLLTNYSSPQQGWDCFTDTIPLSLYWNY